MAGPGAFQIEFVGGPADGKREWLQKLDDTVVVGSCGIAGVMNGELLFHRYRLKHRHPEMGVVTGIYEYIYEGVIESQKGGN